MAYQRIANLVQGVSQQAPQQRRDSQCEAQINSVNSPLSGNLARPPSRLLKHYPGVSLVGSYFTEFRRDNEDYLVIAAGGQVRVIDLKDGTECTTTVAAGADFSYLSDIAGSELFKVRTQAVNDFIFVMSRTVVPRMKTDIVPARQPEALVYLRAGAFDSIFRVTVTGATSVTATVVTNDGDNAAEAQAAKTDSIIASLAQQLNTNGFVAEASGSTLRVIRSDGGDFNIVTSDGNGDDYMTAFKGTAQNFSRLPKRGFDGVRLKVKGESKTTTDDYYVVYQGGPSTGAWVEAVAPLAHTTIDPASMPHVLVNTGYRTFEWRRPSWSTRIAGDDLSPKDPSFIGKRLRDIFFDQTRLAIISEASIVWSKSRFPYTFFPDTLQTVLATAPVDVDVPAVKTARGTTTPDFAVLVDEGTFIWAPRSQYRVSSGNEAFKQETIEMKPSSAYEYASTCEPLALGGSVYFASEAGPYANVRNLQFNNGRPQGDTDVTSHVGRYIPAGVKGLTASDTLRELFLWTAGKPGSLFLYNYLVDKDEYAQSAWNEWPIAGGDILWAGISGAKLRFMQQRVGGVALVEVDLTPEAVDTDDGAEYATRMDLRVDETKVAVLTYNEANDTTSFTMPYSPIGDVWVGLRANGPRGLRGKPFKVTSVVAASVTVQGNLTGAQFYVGQAVVHSREETEFFVRSDQGVVPNDSLTINSFEVALSKSSYTRLEVVERDRGVVRGTKEFLPKDTVYDATALGKPTVTSGKVRIEVGRPAQEVTLRIINDTFLPSAWQGAAYDYTLVGGPAGVGRGR